MRIGDLFHVVHVVDDLPAAEAWYDRVFQPTYMFRRHDSPLDRRTASLVLIADLPAEPMTPHPGPEGEAGTIGRFHRRFGPRLHSLAYYCDSVGEGYERFRSLGVRVTGDGGALLTEPPERGGIYTHPRDTFGLIELMEPRVGGRGGAPIGDSLGECYDPRLLGTHDPSRWSELPLGIRRTAYLTVLVDDLDRALELYEVGLDAVPFHERDAPRSVDLLVGPSSVVRLLVPEPGSIEAESMARDGAMIWSVAFEVRDVGAAGTFLAEAGVGTSERDGVLTISTADAAGARYELVDAPVPGDPRG
jgi:catechol 2,3-dioxygenase-like lactoylglutathione lyase family enzyme